MTSPHETPSPSRKHRTTRRGRIAAAAVLAAVLLSPAAYAADYSPPPDFTLRGSETPTLSEPTYPNWSGFYFGAQAGRSFATADFGNSTSALISYILRDTELQNSVSSWTTLPQSSTGGQSYGGFAGYNIQWGDVITGLELNYNHLGLSSGAQDTEGPLIIPGATQSNGSTVQYAVTVQSRASVSITDIMTARARVGWMYDRLLPYAFGGLAIGRADVTRYASVTGTKTVTPLDPVTGQPNPALATTGDLILPGNPQSQTSNGRFAYGVTFGLGMEVGLLPNLFLRGEWEYVAFNNIDNVKLQANTARVGLGLKF
jgi:outer membrane immunogenic protein